MKTYDVVRPRLHEMLHKLQIRPIDTIYEPGRTTWVYDRTDPRTDAAIAAFYTLMKMDEQRKEYQRMANRKADKTHG
jgi:hypothetical protein